MQDHDIDFDRDGRLGFPEFVFGESKSAAQIAAILDAFRARGESCLVTRVAAETGGELAGTADDLRHDPAARTLLLGTERPTRDQGLVAIVAAGTSDAPVVAECAAVLRFLGLEARLHVDKGVAGVHRLMTSLPDIREADVVICVAGFEGALPSVLSGLVGRPVIGVPTSVGYGVAEGGVAALHAMLASCASGLVVVNIDNGFGAAIAAARILNLDRTRR
jgi:NCAIR mutase (PurE)-related protein